MKKNKKLANTLMTVFMFMALLSSVPSKAMQISQNIAVEKWKAFWVVVSGNATLCVPAVAFIFKNIGSRPLGTLVLNATFLNPAKKVVFATGNSWVNNNGQIPPGYTYAGMVYGTVGYVYGLGACSGAMPSLTANVTVQDFNGGYTVDALQNAPVHTPKHGGMFTYYPGQPQDDWVRSHVFK